MINHVIYQEELNRITESSLPWNNLDGCNLLITGASGLIGSMLADVIIYHNKNKNGNINLWLMGRNEAALKLRYGNYMKDSYVHFLVQDVCKEIEINTPIDYIVHGAGKGDPQSFAEDPVGVMNANYIGMFRVLELARKKHTKKVVYISSGEVYGILDPIRCKEAGMKESDYGYLDIINPRACYASSKRAAETLCISYKEQYGINVSIARPCHTYGAAMSEKDSRVIGEFLRCAIDKRNIIMKSPGLQKRSYCYIADTAEALLYIMLKGKNGCAYNISNSKSVITIRELAELIAKKADIKVTFQNSQEAEKRGYSNIMNAVLDSAALEEIGWKPYYTIEEGLNRALTILKSIYS